MTIRTASLTHQIQKNGARLHRAMVIRAHSHGAAEPPSADEVALLEERRLLKELVKPPKPPKAPKAPKVAKEAKAPKDAKASKGNKPTRAEKSTKKAENLEASRRADKKSAKT